MQLKILWMYHDIMDLYGDKGNIMVLEKRCQDRNIDVLIDTCGIDEIKDLTTYNLVFLGGGADKEQKLIIDDLLKRKDNIIEALNSNTFFFLVCGGYQLFGQYYIDGSNHRINGLQLFDYYSETDENHRCVGNIAIEANLDGYLITAIGFENHGGQTKNVTNPLGKVIKGYGNDYQGKDEGFYNGQVLGTYMHGPLLPKNPQIADFIIYKALKKDNPNLSLEDLTLLDDDLETKAFNFLYNKIVGSN